MRVLVTGARGQLGTDCVRECQKQNHEVIGVDIDEMDITNLDNVLDVMQKVKPDAVIHCAAWTAVDAAEDSENREQVFAINATGTKHIAIACKKQDCKLMYISTDYVFDGSGTAPWKPDCQNYHPVNVYGESKLAGEKAVSELVRKNFIVRIAWVFGEHGNNFIKTMLKIGSTSDKLTIVQDQIGTPTYTFDLARLLVDMIATDKYGYYHATNEGGYISWFDFAKEIFRQAVLLGDDRYSEENLTICPVTTEEYGISKAKRPLNSRLDKSKLVENGFVLLPDWKDAVAAYVEGLVKIQAL